MKYDYKEIVEYLLDWYDLNARILPWRENPVPYYVWVSEIMLQQTRVEAVKGYFERFIEELPDITALAEAKEDKLLKLWEGLGYYNRVRNLQEAARTIVKEYEGEIPADYDKILKLKGIGPYTAGAVASIAFQIPVPAVDGNVLRVTKRIASSFDDITKQRVKKEVEEDLKSIMPKDRPGDFNQALMELGATICIPNGKPYCEKCPVMHLCKGFQNDTMLRIPCKPPKKERKIEHKTVLLLEYKGRYAIRKRESKGLLAGVYEFLNIEGIWEETELREKVYPDDMCQIQSLGEAKHIFSHVEWRMVGYHMKLLKKLEEEGFVWASKQEIAEKYMIPSAFDAFREKIYN